MISQTLFSTVFLSDDLELYWQDLIRHETDALLEKLKNPPEKHRLLFQVMKELFEQGQSETLTTTHLSIHGQDHDLLFKNLTRLLFATALNGQYPQIEKELAFYLSEASFNIAEEVKKEANGYPNGSIAALVWVIGSSMRDGMGDLTQYFEMKGFTEDQLWVHNMRTVITLHIMGHYPHMVFPDMVKLAQLEEKKGQHKAALATYEAVTMDAQDNIGWFLEEVNEAPDEDEKIALQWAIHAYEGMTRLTSTSYLAQIQEIQGILHRQKV
jgi:hypothetical protein